MQGSNRHAEAGHGTAKPCQSAYPRALRGISSLLGALNKITTQEGLVNWCIHALVSHLPHEAFMCCLGKQVGKTTKPIHLIIHGLMVSEVLAY